MSNKFKGKLDKDAKEVWVAALRSGEFKQGKGKLKYRSHRENRFCCLGVACEVLPGISPSHQYAGNPPYYFLSPESLKLLGLTQKDQERLADLNDGSAFSGLPRHNFNQIADIIEAKL